MSLSSKPVLGVTVLPEYFQYETVSGVLDRLQAAGINAITTSPYVMEPADAASGAREPPVDAGAGAVRLLDRPLWGKRELWVRTAPSFTPNLKHYRDLQYQPPSGDALTERDGAIIRAAIADARSRGMQTCFQVQAAIPPGYRVQFGGPCEADLPRLPNGQVPQGRVANNGSLASPNILAYQHALLTDLCEQYPELDAIRVDWPEYPPYSLDDMFVDFSPHSHQAADRLGFDFEKMKRDASGLYERLHGGLSDRALHKWADEREFPYAIAELLFEFPGILEFLRFKAALVEELLAGFRRSIDAAGRPDLGLIANLFPYPWSLPSGATNYRHIARHCNALAIKLYGMHWKMMIRSYCDRLRDANPQVSPALLVPALLRILDVVDASAPTSIEAYSYPGPDEPHDASTDAQRRKIQFARDGSPGRSVYALMHGYGPVDDFLNRWRVAWEASPDGIWINRYGYLSDAKIERMREFTDSAAGS